jgi:ketosteroid isomerase-like protein
MHRTLLVVVGFAAAVAASSCTQATPQREAAAPAMRPVGTVGQSDTPSDVEATITQLERDWVAAIVKNDSAAVGTLLADDFVGTSPTAHTFTKSLALQDMKSGKYGVQSMLLDEITVNTYGDVAVAFSSQQEKSRYNGKDVSGHYHYTDVWVKKDGKWQVVASHGTRYDEGHSRAES